MMKLQLLKLITILTVFTFSTTAKECDFVKPEVQLPENYSTNLDILQIATRALSFSQDGVTFYTDLTELQKKDRRKQKSRSTSADLDSVGRIKVTYRDGKISHCSGTLISTVPGQSSRVIKSAAHCFGNTITEEKHDIKSITWEVTTKSGQRIVKELNIEILELDRDNAVLSFNGKIPFKTIKPALVEVEIGMNPDELFDFEPTRIISAGYSADNYKGNGGKTMTYDDEITWRSYRGHPSDSHRQFIMDTVAFSGGSGGALLVEANLEEEGIENPYKQLYYAGTTLSLDESSKYYKLSSSDNAAGASRIRFDTYQGIDDKVVAQLNR